MGRRAPTSLLPLATKAHNEICTYSKATRNNVEVTTEVV